MPLNCPDEAWTRKDKLEPSPTFGCIFYVHVELDRRSKLDPKSKRCIFIRHETIEYSYRFENRKVLRHKNAVFNERKVYKDLLTERSNLEDLRLAPQSTPEQQSSAANSEFVELDDVPVEKSQSIPKENGESQIEPLTFQSEVR